MGFVKPHLAKRGLPDPPPAVGPKHPSPHRAAVRIFVDGLGLVEWTLETDRATPDESVLTVSAKGITKSRRMTLRETRLGTGALVWDLVGEMKDELARGEKLHG
jgi:hypothetical protein